MAAAAVSGSRPAFPLRGGHASARGGAQDALGRFVAPNATVLSKPRGPVMRTRTPPVKGSAAIQASNGLPEALPGGLHGRLDALAPGGEDSLAIEDGQGHGVHFAGHAGGW